MAVIWWMRRDLRLSDQPALAAALDTGEPVVPLFVADPKILEVRNMGAARLHFCFASVGEVDARLKEADAGYVITRHGTPETILREVAAATGARQVFAQRDYTPLARGRDRRVAEALEEEGITLTLTPGQLIVEPEELLTKSKEKPYVVYGPYKKRWLARRPPEPAPPHWPEVPDLRTPRGIGCDALPALASLGFEPPDTLAQTPGERAARERLDEWFDLRREDSIASYARSREAPADRTGTSLLSGHLRFGTLGPRDALAAALDARERTGQEAVRESIDVWISELIWRDFYNQALYHHPRMLAESYVRKYDGLAWRYEEDAIQAWKEGRTGYPFVDAGMRQMAAIGWMHNRTRMAVAGFLTKHLLVDWRTGYDDFMRRLLDGDPANNVGGWQWAASSGPSAQPYFRVFNPVSQSRKHDPDGAYIRRWLPELREVPDRYIHQPWTMPASVQEEAGCLIGRDYPAPLVDHDEARDRALAAYRSV